MARSRRAREFNQSETVKWHGIIQKAGIADVSGKQYSHANAERVLIAGAGPVGSPRR